MKYFVRIAQYHGDHSKYENLEVNKRQAKEYLKRGYTVIIEDGRIAYFMQADMLEEQEKVVFS